MFFRPLWGNLLLPVMGFFFLAFFFPLLSLSSPTLLETVMENGLHGVAVAPRDECPGSFLLPVQGTPQMIHATFDALHSPVGKTPRDPQEIPCHIPQTVKQSSSLPAQFCDFAPHVPAAPPGSEGPAPPPRLRGGRTGRCKVQAHRPASPQFCLFLGLGSPRQAVTT